MLKNLLYISISLTAAVIIVIGGSIYLNITTSTINETTSQRIIPIDSSFDQNVINSLVQRKEVPVDLQQESVIASTSSQTVPLQSVHDTPPTVFPTPQQAVSPSPAALPVALTPTQTPNTTSPIQ